MRALAPLVVILAAAPALSEEAAKPVGNPYLLAARRLYGSLEFEKSLEQLERARAFPGTSQQELVEIEKYTGLVKYELGEVDAARAAFRTALALDPSTEIPADVSPKINAEWTTLQRERAAQDQAQAKAVPKPRPPEVKPQEVPRPEVAVVEPPQRVDLTPVARPEVVVTRVEPPPAEPSAISSVGPFVVLGTGAVLGGAGGLFGYLSSQQTSLARSTPIQLEAEAHNAAAGQRALTANVLYAAAGAAVLGGALWLLVR